MRNRYSMALLTTICRWNTDSDVTNCLPSALEMTFLSLIIVTFTHTAYTSNTSPAFSHRMSCIASKPCGVRTSNCRISAMMSSVSDGLVWVM